MIYHDVTDPVIQKDLFVMLVEVYAALAIVNLVHNSNGCLMCYGVASRTMS